MLNGVKSIGYYTAVGAISGGLIGAGIIGCRQFSACVDMTQFASFMYPASSDLKFVSNLCYAKATDLTFQATLLGAAFGGAAGLAFGVAKVAYSAAKLFNSSEKPKEPQTL